MADPGYELYLEHFYTHQGNPRADCLSCFPPEATPLVVFRFPGRPNPFERDGPRPAFDGPFPPELGERPANPFQRDLSSFGGPDVAPGDRLTFDDAPFNVLQHITLRGLPGDEEAERELAELALGWLRGYAEDHQAEARGTYSGEEMMAAWRAGYDRCADYQSDQAEEYDDL
jgi:hypothetical protein